MKKRLNNTFLNAQTSKIIFDKYSGLMRFRFLSMLRNGILLIRFQSVVIIWNLLIDKDISSSFSGISECEDPISWYVFELNFIVRNRVGTTFILWSGLSSALA